MEKNTTGGWDTLPTAKQPPTVTLPNIDKATTNTAVHQANNSTFRIHIVQVQFDIGANLCVFDNKYIMVDYQDITLYPVGGGERDAVSLVCTGTGFIQWYSTEGILHMVECLYSKYCDGTLITPTSIVELHSDK